MRFRSDDQPQHDPEIHNMNTEQQDDLNAAEYLRQMAKKWRARPPDQQAEFYEAVKRTFRKELEPVVRDVMRERPCDEGEKAEMEAAILEALVKRWLEQWRQLTSDA
jgi:hypothetical protein